MSGREETFLDGRVRLILGDCREVLRTLPDESVNCVVTSPPYFGLRDYGVEGQIGLEPTPDAFVAEMVAVFREVRRVLRKDGTFWLNLGDSYASGGRKSRDPGLSKIHPAFANESYKDGLRPADPPGIKPKDLLGIPWRVAFALQADGWWLRQDIIWSKPNPMPESVTDRCTKAHEYLFLLSKSDRYHFDAAAIAEPLARPEELERATPAVFGGRDKHVEAGKQSRLHSGNEYGRPQRARAKEIARKKGLTEEHFAAIRACGITDAGKAQVTQTGFGKNTAEVQKLADEAKVALGGYYREFLSADTRNKRSVWSVASQPFKEAHFATFPPALIEPCIKAGCPVGGAVLDPFSGAGTVGLVAATLGRRCDLIELNPEYCTLAKARIEAAFMGKDEGARHMARQTGKVTQDAGPLFEALL